MYQFVGGGAGDDARFQQTHVFCGTEAYTDAAVALEILSHKPIGIGVRHPWQPAGPPLRVTAAEAMRLTSLNAVQAVEVFAEHAEATGQIFDPADPIPFFLHNVLGISTPDGHKLRVPLAVDEAGCVTCAAEVPAGTTAHIMSCDVASAAAAATDAVRDALAQVAGHRRQGELALQASEVRYRSLVEATTQVIWVCDAEGRLTAEQPSWAAFTGQCFHEYRDFGWAEAIHPGDRDALLAAWRAATAARHFRALEVRVLRHDGVYRLFGGCAGCPSATSQASSASGSGPAPTSPNTARPSGRSRWLNA